MKNLPTTGSLSVYSAADPPHTSIEPKFSEKLAKPARNVRHETVCRGEVHCRLDRQY